MLKIINISNFKETTIKFIQNKMNKTQINIKNKLQMNNTSSINLITIFSKQEIMMIIKTVDLHKKK